MDNEIGVGVTIDRDDACSTNTSPCYEAARHGAAIDVGKFTLAVDTGESGSSLII